jgi:uncharacterized UBP type Zn finger protein
MTNIADKIQRVLADAAGRGEGCDHLTKAGVVVPSADGCEKCLQMGNTWVHLRLCLICGHVGCCDNSKNKHAAKHYHSTGHPIIMSFEANEEWMWCYPDKALIVP